MTCKNRPSKEIRSSFNAGQCNPEVTDQMKNLPESDGILIFS